MKIICIFFFLNRNKWNNQNFIFIIFVNPFTVYHIIFINNYTFQWEEDLRIKIVNIIVLIVVYFYYFIDRPKLDSYYNITIKTTVPTNLSVQCDIGIVLSLIFLFEKHPCNLNVTVHK